MKRGKKYVEAAKLVDRATLYDVNEAVSIVKKASSAKFDETVEAHIRTVTMDVAKAIKEIKAGKIEYRLDKSNIIHVPVGKVSFTEEQLADNFQALMGAVIKARPSTLKGTFLKSVTMASTMGPGVKLNTVKFGQ